MFGYSPHTAEKKLSQRQSYSQQTKFVEKKLYRRLIYKDKNILYFYNSGFDSDKKTA